MADPVVPYCYPTGATQPAAWETAEPSQQSLQVVAAHHAMAERNGVFAEVVVTDPLVHVSDLPACQVVLSKGETAGRSSAVACAMGVVVLGAGKQDCEDIYGPPPWQHAEKASVPKCVSLDAYTDETERLKSLKACYEGVTIDAVRRAQ